MSNFPRSFLKGDIALVFGSTGFSGGRLNKEGNGIVEIEFSADAKNRELDISMFDNMSSEDGHYSPVVLTRNQAALLHEWLGCQLNAMDLPAA